MYEERIKRVLAAMEQMGLEQMLVSDPDSIWYLTGYDVFPFERLYAFYLRKDGQHKLFLNKLFPVPEAPYEQVWFSDTDDYLAKEHLYSTEPNCSRRRLHYIKHLSSKYRESGCR